MHIRLPNIYIAIKLPTVVLAFPVSKGLYIVASVNISADNTVTVSTQ